MSLVVVFVVAVVFIALGVTAFAVAANHATQSGEI